MTFFLFLNIENGFETLIIAFYRSNNEIKKTPSKKQRGLWWS